MKKKAILSLIAALTAGSVLFAGGCGVDLTTINEEDTTLSAEIEAEDLADGTLQIHFIWYSSDQSSLTSATVTLSDESGELFSGTTDDSGSLEACTLPGNTVITCEVADDSGEIIASSKVIFKISSDYSDLTVYTTSADEEESQCILEIPTDYTDIRAAIFLTEDGQLSFSNLTPWSDSYETDESGDEEDEDASDDEDVSDEEDTSSDESSSESENSKDASSDKSSSDKADSSADESTDGDAADNAE